MKRQPQKKGSKAAVRRIAERLPTGEGFSSMVKIVEHASNDVDGPNDDVQKIVATLPAKRLSSNSPLRNVRAMFNKIITEKHTFIFPDGSPAHEGLLLSTYLNYLDECETVRNSSNPGKITDTEPQEKAQADDVRNAGDEDGKDNEDPDKKTEIGNQVAPKASSASISRAGGEKTRLNERKIHIRGPPPIPRTAVSILKDGSFVITMVEWSGSQSPEDGLRSTATIQSTTLAEVNLANIQLKDLRKKLAALSPMSATSMFHKFCTSKGVPITDEAIKFSDYLKLETTKVAEEPDIATIIVYYRKDSRIDTATVDMAKLPGAYDPNAPVKVKEDAFASMGTAKAFEPHERSWDSNNVAEPRSSISSRSAAELTEKEWPIVISQCGLMYGWVVDRARNEIVRARKPAFKLRSKEIENPGAAIPEFLRELANDDELLAEPNSIKAFQKQTDEPERYKRTKENATNVSPATETSSNRKDQVGDQLSNAVGRAISASCRNKEGNHLTIATSGHDSAVYEGDRPTSLQDERENDSADDSTDPGDGEDSDLEVAHNNVSDGRGRKKDAPDNDSDDNRHDKLTVNYHSPQSTVSCKIPNFLVNDDSKIEVITVSHEFERSMATNDFSNKSIEGSMTGGYAGFAATVSGGVASSESNSNLGTRNEFQKTMVAKYLFPRADVILHPESIEPSEELKESLERVGKTMNVQDLRTLQREFGQLFSQKVTLGGRLQSTKVMTEVKESSEQVQKEQFKASVGLQISTPFGVGVGVKAETETGKMTGINTTDINRKEAHVFEAVGGETILASSPELWIDSVAAYKNWRVIKRDDLSPLVDILAAIPGYASVRRMFLQAVPTLSQYLHADAARELTVRFRLCSPLTQLSLSYLKKQAATSTEEKTPALSTPSAVMGKGHLHTTENILSSIDKAPSGQGNAVYYLGHDFLQAVSPTLMGIRPDNIWGEPIPSNPPKPLFSPQQYRAPTIMGYRSDRPDISSRYTQDFANTVWNITAPFNETLQHGAKVIIRTKPVDSPITSSDPSQQDSSKLDAKQPPATFPVSMVVFRNAQGVFLPAMSNADDVHYWRILKIGARRVGENIREGDTIRLCWTFNDQTLGFRDFKDDVFGRRRVQMPRELGNSSLYLKLPWPRFESLSPPENSNDPGSNTMVMSAQGTQKTILAEINTITSMGLGRSTVYGLQDVLFYIDAVANKGIGDTEDYLLKGLAQGGQTDKGAWDNCNSRNVDLAAKRRIIYQTFFLENEAS